MDGRTWLYAGLLLVVVALMGFGVWFVVRPSQPVSIPEGEPIIIMDISYVMGGEQSQLSVYDDGTIIYWKDTGLKTAPSAEETVTRVWRTGKLDAEDLADFIEFIEIVGFSELDEYYQSPDTSLESGVISDLYCTISVNNGDIDNKVMAFGYFIPDSENPYSELPYPFGEIYEELDSIIQNSTEEVYREEIAMDDAVTIHEGAE